MLGRLPNHLIPHNSQGDKKDAAAANNQIFIIPAKFKPKAGDVLTELGRLATASVAVGISTPCFFSSCCVHADGGPPAAQAGKTVLQEFKDRDQGGTLPGFSSHRTSFC